MKLLHTLEVGHHNGASEIRLYHGNLAEIPAGEEVDLLVLSAFEDNYAPTASSVIGALARRGLSVEALARAKAVDLRSTFGCWLSQRLPAEVVARFRFDRILCFEPSHRGSPPEVVGEIFQCLMPFAWAQPPIRSIAMPLVASGNMRVPASVMFEPLIEAAVQWLRRGLPVEVIRIVEINDAKAEDLRRRMIGLGRKLDLEPAPSATPSEPAFHVFVSYAHEDAHDLAPLLDALVARRDLRVFLDRLEIRPGMAWQEELANAIEASRKVVAFYSPAYLSSKICREEFNLARLRHAEEDDVLYPVLLRSAALPLYMRAIHYLDCREADGEKLRAAVDAMADAVRAVTPRSPRPGRH